VQNAHLYDVEGGGIQFSVRNAATRNSFLETLLKGALDIETPFGAPYF